MAADGIAVFANNHRSGNHAFYRRSLDEHFSEVTDLRRENSQLKEMLAEMALRIRWFKKNEVVPGEDPDLG